MSRRYVYCFLAVAIIIALSAATGFIIFQRQPAVSIANLTYYTEQFPPCNYQENGTVKGIAVDLLTEITDKIGDKITPDKVNVLPWTEAYQTALNGSNIVLFSTARLPEREQSFKWAGPLFMDTCVLFARWDNTAPITTASDLNGYKIGVIKDSAAAMQLKNAGVAESNFVYFTNSSIILQQLLSGEIDFWCNAKVVGRTIAQQATGNYYAVKVVYHLDDYEYYYEFSRDVSDSTVNAFQQAIDVIKNEKDSAGSTVYEKILERYIPTQGMSRSPEELVAFVNTAYEYAQQNGKGVAVNAFNQQTGQFIKDELYIFAYDMEGNTLALPFQPEIIGTNRWNATDPDGTAFIQQIIHTAQAGGGFVCYTYLDPTSNIVKPKLSYVMGVDQDWLIGAGIYQIST